MGSVFFVVYIFSNFRFEGFNFMNVILIISILSFLNVTFCASSPTLCCAFINSVLKPNQCWIVLQIHNYLKILHCEGLLSHQLIFYLLKFLIQFLRFTHD